MLFKGSGVALVTPFNEDLSVNYDKLKELINEYIVKSFELSTSEEYIKKALKSLLLMLFLLMLA